jgi:hypothetical protein
MAFPQQSDRTGAVPVSKERSEGRRIPLPSGIRVVRVDGTSGTTLPWTLLGVENGAPSAGGAGPVLACGSGTTPATPPPPTSTGGGGSFSLNIYEGYRFSDRKVVKSDDNTADISFYPSYRYTLPTPILGGVKINEYAQKPDPGSISASVIDSWYDIAPAPTTGYYYLLRGADARYYLVRLTKFNNAGAAMSQWQIDFTWEQVQVRP